MLIDAKSPPHEKWRSPSPNPLDRDYKLEDPDETQLSTTSTQTPEEGKVDHGGQPVPEVIKPNQGPRRERPTQVQEASQPPLKADAILAFSKDQFQLLLETMTHMQKAMGEMEQEIRKVKTRQERVERARPNKALGQAPTVALHKSSPSYGPTQKSSALETPPESIENTSKGPTVTAGNPVKPAAVVKEERTDDSTREKPKGRRTQIDQEQYGPRYTAVKGKDRKTLYVPIKNPTKADTDGSSEDGSSGETEIKTQKSHGESYHTSASHIKTESETYETAPSTEGYQSDATVKAHRFRKNAKILHDKIKSKGRRARPNSRPPRKSPSQTSNDGYKTASSQAPKDIVGPYKQLKLVPFVLPKFDGNDSFKYQEWETMFHRAYGSNPRMDDLTRLYYLKQHVSGNAEVLLNAVSMTPENYKVALDILDRNFQNNVDPLEKLYDDFSRCIIDQHDYTKMNLDVNCLATMVFQMRNHGGQIDTPHIYLPFIRKLPGPIKEKMLGKIQRAEFDKSFEMVYKWVTQYINTKKNAAAMSLNEARKTGGFEPVDREVNKADITRIAPIGKQLFPGEGRQPEKDGTNTKTKKDGRCCFHVDPEEPTDHSR